MINAKLELNPLIRVVKSISEADNALMYTLKISKNLWYYLWIFYGYFLFCQILNIYLKMMVHDKYFKRVIHEIQLPPLGLFIGFPSIIYKLNPYDISFFTQFYTQSSTIFRVIIFYILYSRKVINRQIKSNIVKVIIWFETRNYIRLIGD